MARQWIRPAWAALVIGAAASRALAEQGCEQPPHDGLPLADRQERIARYEGLPEQCLKDLVVACNAAASRQLLDSGTAFTCSIGYEALLRRGFGGDFQRLMAWWHAQGRQGEQARE